MGVQDYGLARGSFRDGHTAEDTDLASVAGAILGDFCTGVTCWPFVFRSSCLQAPVVVLPPTTVPPGCNHSTYYLFVDPLKKDSSGNPAPEFRLTTSGNASGTEPTMAYSDADPNATDPEMGAGAFVHVHRVGNTAQWMVSAQFDSTAAHAVFTGLQQSPGTTFVFNGTRVTG